MIEPRDTQIYEVLHIVTHALTAALRHKDLHTQLHSSRVIDLAVLLGKQCNLDPNDLELLKISASLHDIGKIGINEPVLLKPGPLDDTEWGEMKTHAAIGADIVTNLGIEGSGQIAAAIRHHHENFAGNGYPDSLSGEGIPFLSRIISIADCFDAMTETRPYHAPRTQQQALDFVLAHRDNKFDPYIVDRFESLMTVA